MNPTTITQFAARVRVHCSYRELTMKLSGDTISVARESLARFRAYESSKSYGDSVLSLLGWDGKRWVELEKVTT
jgi:hypothetical protein